MIGLVLALAPHASVGLPELNRVLPFHFSMPYSCSMSYNTSAMFLSSASLDMNSPELLYNGNCHTANPSFEASTGADDFSVIADVGERDIVNASSSRAFNWPNNVVGESNTFKAAVPVIANHLYAVLLTKSEFRALFWVKVSADFKPDGGALDITYAVRSYAVMKEVSSSPGFNWTSPNKL